MTRKTTVTYTDKNMSQHLLLCHHAPTHTSDIYHSTNFKHLLFNLIKLLVKTTYSMIFLNL